MFYLTDHDRTDALDMKLHTDKLTSADIYKATYDLPGVSVDVTPKGSRSKDHAFDVRLTGTSPRRPNSGRSGAGDEYAATWDEWGIFFARLYEIDPEMTNWAYDNSDDFHWKTAARFHALIPAQQCRVHKFEYTGSAATGSYHVAQCNKCEAIKRY